MRILLIITFLLSTILLASNPKIFSPLNNPVFNDYQSLLKIKRSAAIKADEKVLFAFIVDVKSHKKEGFALDKKIKAGVITKEESNNYLKESRKLSSLHQKISSFVKNRSLTLLDQKKYHSYLTLYNSGLQLFKKDKRLLNAHKKVSKEIRKIEQKKEKALKKKRVITQAKKMKKTIIGSWRGTRTTDKARVKIQINKKSLVMKFKYPDHSYMLKGTYTVKGKYLIFHISTRTLYSQGKKHKRSVDLSRKYRIYKLTSNRLTIYHKSGEKLTLRR